MGVDEGEGRGRVVGRVMEGSGSGECEGEREREGASLTGHR